MTFVQVIEYKTSHPEKLSEIMDRWMSETQGKRTASHSVMMSDRDHPGMYMVHVEFPSYEEAMRNSKLPETDKFAKQLAELCDGAPVFHNLDVVREETL